MPQDSSGSSPVPNAADPTAVVARIDAIDQITQIRGLFEQFPLEPTDSVEVALTKPTTRAELVDDSHLTVLVEQALELRPSREATEQPATPKAKESQEAQESGAEEAESQALFRVAATFLVLYRLKAGEKPTDDQLRAFADQNGVFNVTPYWREYVGSCLARTGLPSFMVPVMKIDSEETDTHEAPKHQPP